MEVSFKGINNLYIAKRNYSKFGSYLAHDYSIRQGQKDYVDILIKCDLTNDARGNDLNEFLNTLAKCRPCYQKNCINPQKPSQLKLLMRHFTVKDDVVDVLNSNFDINDYEIMLDEREILPLFSYMAKLTRTIASAEGLSVAYQKYAKFVNAAIHNEAINFIENLMPLNR